MYLKRNERGEISALSEGQIEGFVVMTNQDEDDVNHFRAVYPFDGRLVLKYDLAFVRVIEDVIELLMKKNIIQFTELPDISQMKMLQRKQLRDGMPDKLDLLDNEDSFFGKN